MSPLCGFRQPETLQVSPPAMVTLLGHGSALYWGHSKNYAMRNYRIGII